MKKRIKRKIILSLSLICILTIVIGLTYGVFTIDAGKYNATSMLISNLIYGIDIKTTGGTETINGKEVSLTSGNTSTVLVKITSLNPIDSNYSLEYKITEGEGKVYYASNTGWLPIGTISKDGGLVYAKTVKVVLEATNNMKVNFNVSGGYSYDTNIISLAGYNKITEPYNKSETSNNEENLKDIVCKEDTCEYGGQTNNNYLQYPTNTDVTKNIWRILGVKENGIKIISNLTENTSVSNISNSLNTFYNTLENKEEYILNTNKFNCNETGCDTSTYTNIGLISTFEYNKVGGLNSYLASSNNFFSLNNGTIENITQSGVETPTGESGLRPVAYLKEDINVTGSGTSSDPYRIYSVGKVITTKYTIDSIPTTTLPSADTYIVKSVTCTGGREGHWDEGTSSVILTKGSAPTTCTVDFTSGYTLTMESSGATISGASNIVVGRIGTKTLSYTPLTGYNNESATITCDNATGVVDKTNKTITISNITSSQKCKLTLSKQTYAVKVTSTNTSYGTITNGSQTVEHGSDVTIILNPSMGSKYLSNTCNGTVSGNILTIPNVTESKNCTVTFFSTVLANAINDKYPNKIERTDFANIEATTKLWKTTDYNVNESFTGTSYYFTGNPDNWVNFAGRLWRIIRINGDGGVRLLYAGTGEEDGYIKKTEITTSEVPGIMDYGGFSYNKASDDPMYVGWKYGTSGSLALNRTNENKSYAYLVVENWYQKNIVNKGLEKYISKTAIYCNDRSTDYYGENAFYKVRKRLDPLFHGDRTVHPTLLCDNANDRFKEGFGLITADEVVFASGGYGTINSGSYLYLNASGGSATKSYSWWTMSPSYYTGTACEMLTLIGSQPAELVSSVTTSYTVARPVISLKSNVTFSEGDGSSSNPYKIITD